MAMQKWRPALAIGSAFVTAMLALRTDAPSAQRRTPAAPLPVRNDVPKPGREILVLRNHQLRKGGYEAFYKFSRDAYWPYFERIGARIVGQWKIIEPAAAPNADREVYRLVRYASFEHWQMTRVRWRLPARSTWAGTDPTGARGGRRSTSGSDSRLERQGSS